MPACLQVWLGPGIADPAQLAAAAAQDSLPQPVVPPGAEGLPASGLLPSGRRCTVACILTGDAVASSSAIGSIAPAPAPGGLPQRQAASFDEQQRLVCAERLCRAVSLFYRINAEDAGLAGVWQLICECPAFACMRHGELAVPAAAAHYATSSSICRTHSPPGCRYASSSPCLLQTTQWVLAPWCTVRCTTA
jgi:hypothetical protein